MDKETEMNAVPDITTIDDPNLIDAGATVTFDDPHVT